MGCERAARWVRLPLASASSPPPWYRWPATASPRRRSRTWPRKPGAPGPRSTATSAASSSCSTRSSSTRPRGSSRRSTPPRRRKPRSTTRSSRWVPPRPTRCSEHDALQFVLAHEPELVLPWITFDGADRFLALAGAALAPTFARYVPAADANRAAQWCTRIFLAYLGAENSPVTMTDAREVRALVHDFVAPALRAPASQPNGEIRHGNEPRDDRSRRHQRPRSDPVDHQPRRRRGAPHRQGRVRTRCSAGTTNGPAPPSSSSTRRRRRRSGTSRPTSTGRSRSTRKPS